MSDKFYVVTESMEGGYMPSWVERYDNHKDAMECFSWTKDDLESDGYAQDFEEIQQDYALAHYQPTEIGEDGSIVILENRLGQVIELSEISAEDYEGEQC